VVVGRIRNPYVDSRDVGLFHFGFVDAIPRRESVLCPNVRDRMLQFLVHQAERHTGKYVATLCLGLAWFEEWVFRKGQFGPGEVVAGGLPELIAGFAEHSRSIRRSGCNWIRHFFRWGYQRRLPGFDRRSWIRIRREKFYSVKSGRIAKLGHPSKGALSVLEQRVVRQALLSPSHRTRAADRVLVWFFFEIGCRPGVAARVKREHLRRSFLGDQFFIEVPRSKRRRATRATVEREISVNLGTALEEYASSHESPWLFPQLRLLRENQKPSDLVAKAMKRFVRANQLTTIRVPNRNTRWGLRDGLLPLQAYRFRYTLASNLALRGATPEEIAAILDDDTLEMALIYTDYSSWMVDLLEATLDEYPLWRRTILVDFKGVVLDDLKGEGFMVFAGATHLSGFVMLRRRRLVIGKCQKKTPCSKRPPVSCYTCEWFGASTDPQRHLAQFIQIRDHLRSGGQPRPDRMVEVLLPDLLAIRGLLDDLGHRPASMTVSEAIMDEQL